jgi:hypothetical protein
MKEGEWTELRPGGDTVCGRNTTYVFYVRKGKPGLPVIYELEGGGACWSVSTCQKSTGTFSDTVDGTRALFERVIKGEDRKQGLGDQNGPYKDFTHVYVPYCTGDLHIGNADVQYSDTLSIRHRGYNNARAVLDWAVAQLPAPPRLLVTGCSAGSYGSIFWGAEIARSFPTSKVTQMGDSGMGLVSDDFMSDSIPVWNALEGGFPLFVVPSNVSTNPREDLDLTTVSLPLVYRWVAEYFPEHLWSQFSSAYDWNQAFFLKTQKIDKNTIIDSQDKIDWNAEMNALYDPFRADDPDNLLSLMGPGEYHCNVHADSHWNVDVGDGSPLYKVMHDMFLKDVNPGNIDCRDNGSCLNGVDLRDELDTY